MKTIGQFAKDNNVTIKTLHHYEKMELITPTKVDPDTGYRYYSEKESLDLRIILFLKELGFSLSEVKKVIDTNLSDQELLESLVFKLKQSSNELESISQRIYKIETMIEMIGDNGTEGKLNLKELIVMSESQLDTGKHGRGKFTEEAIKMFEQAKQNKTCLSVIQMDLDHFHQVNQKYGYDIGDIVLRRTTDEIVSVLETYDYHTLLQRKGGDEYTVIAECSILEASKLSSQILNAVVAVDYSDVAEDLKIAITAGIVALGKRSKSYSELLHKATVKLYEAKQNR